MFGSSKSDRGGGCLYRCVRTHTYTHAHTHTHRYTHTHGGSWPALGKQDLVLAGNPEDLRPGSSRNPLRWTHSAREDWRLYMKSDLDSLPCWCIR